MLRCGALFGQRLNIAQWKRLVVVNALGFGIVVAGISTIFPLMSSPFELIDDHKWLTKWLIIQVEIEHLNSDTIRLNHL